jgi:hypothetical protein
MLDIYFYGRAGAVEPCHSEVVARYNYRFMVDNETYQKVFLYAVSRLVRLC